MGSASAPDFDEVADELYGLPTEEFTAARVGHEKRAKQAGDPGLAARIHALAKPTVTAWLANQLVREHKDELQPFVELGAELREATRALDGDQLRQLSRQQHELVEALVQQGRQLARAAGRAVSDDTVRGLEDTLRAALADERAALLLLAGRLSQALHSDGFAPASDGGSSAPRTPPRAEAAPTAASKRRDEQRQQAERDLTDAEQALSAADSAYKEAKAQLTQAEQAAGDAGKRVKDLREQLDAALATQSRAEQQQRKHATTLDRAEKAVDDARRRHCDARTRRDRLTDRH